jgi:AraC-like DNA-binding protein
LFLTATLSKLQFLSIKISISIYTVAITLLLYPFMLAFWLAGETSIFLFFLIAPLGLSTLYTTRQNIYWCLFYCGLVLLTFLIGQVHTSYPGLFAMIDVPEMLSDEIFAPKCITLFKACALTMSFLCMSNALYGKNKLHDLYVNEYEKFRKRFGKEINDMEMLDEAIEVNTELELDKYISVYRNILIYFKKEKPYADPDFNISRLAAILQTNPTYVSRAIRQNRDMNFSTFVNYYRITDAKKQISENYLNKFTLKYIYTSSGFKNQSTFNKAFKQIEGITPTEYYKKMNVELIID